MKSKKIIFKNILLETLAVGICLLLSSGICYLIVHKYHYLLIEKISVVIGIIGISLILVCFFLKATRKLICKEDPLRPGKKLRERWLYTEGNIPEKKFYGYY